MVSIDHGMIAAPIIGMNYQWRSAAFGAVPVVVVDGPSPEIEARWMRMFPRSSFRGPPHPYCMVKITKPSVFVGTCCLALLDDLDEIELTEDLTSARSTV